MTRVRVGVALIAFVAAAVPQARDVRAQQVRAPAGEIQPRYTRLFGSDTMDMWAPVLSPDGRWVVFVRQEGREAYNLWLVSTSGGDPIRLTSGRHADESPVWFPTGDRIAFRSDRPSSREAPQSYVMTLPVDPRTGRPTAPARQVSLEPTVFTPAVSPDGSRIAYTTSSATRIAGISVIPSTGGTVRQLVTYGDSLASITGLQWSGDGEWISFVVGTKGTNARTISRIRASGGAPEVLGTARMMVGPVVTGPAGRHLLRRVDLGPGQGPTYEVLSPDGQAVARFLLRRNMFAYAFTPDGRALLAAQSNIVAPIRVVPVAGGPVRQLTDAREYDWPAGWSSDGSRVFVWTASNGHGVLLDVPVDGKPATEWPTPSEARSGLVSRDGRYVAYFVGSNAVARPLRILRLADGHVREITATSFTTPGSYLTGPGGLPNGGDEFLYLERREGRLEVWAAPPEGRSRLLRSFPASYAGRTSFGVHGNRIAYWEPRGDSVTLFVAEGPDGSPRQLATVARNPGQSEGSAVWSRSGRWIAADYFPPGDSPRYRVLLVGVGPDGRRSVAPRLLDAGPMWGWQIQWLPDDQGFTVFGMTGAGSETHVYLVSLREGERPVVLTRDDPSVRWGYELSPDGRYIAYPAEIPRGSSLWRVDLGDWRR
ncbi:MAG: PD40 domain-containing protein [Gemmatimonadetes bacterium]|nr:PD40 domain-containing protein [Gemmatimonadota bacterium]